MSSFEQYVNKMISDGPVLGTAKKCTETTDIAHAFGDGATWQKEGITGWGMHIIREGGKTIEDWGRTPGNQNNDASETS